MAQTMIQKDWNCFARTGKIEDYLCYREAQEEHLFATLKWADKLPEESRQKDGKNKRTGEQRDKSDHCNRNRAVIGTEWRI